MKRLALIAVALVMAFSTSGCLSYWSAGHEGGNLNEWSQGGGGGKFNSGIADTIAVNIGGFAHSGSWAARLRATAPPESGTRLFRWAEPIAHDQATYGAHFSFPDVVCPANYWNIFQFKSVTATQNDPFWIINVGCRNGGSGPMYLYLYNWITGTSFEQNVKNLPTGGWVHITVYLDQSSAGTGRLTVKQDGTTLWDKTGITTKYAGSDQHWSVNNYSDGFGGTHDIFIDDAHIDEP